MKPFERGDKVVSEIEHLKNKVHTVKSCFIYLNKTYVSIDNRFHLYYASHFSKVNDRKDRIENLNL